MRRLVALSLVFCACSPSLPAAPVLQASPPLVGAADSAQGDHADHACQVVLRDLALSTDTTCDSSGACWRVFAGTVDVAASAVAAGEVPWVLYQAGDEPTWYQVQLAPATGNRVGYVSYAVAIGAHGVAAGADLATARLHVIPYLWVPAGARLFDHNRVTGDLASYALDMSDNFTVGDDADACAAPVAPTATLRFLAGWTEERHGALVAGGKLVVDYDLHRMPGCVGTTADGVPAWDTVAYARFAPSGQVAQASVKGVPAQDGSWPGAPASFDIPTDATGVALWFESSGAHCTTSWDSAYGANYNFAVESQAPAAPTWAGDWGGSFDRACAHVDGLGDPVHVDEWTLERACMFVDADAYAPGSPAPDDLQAAAEWSLDGVAQPPVWLAAQGRVGNNARYRWTIDRQALTAKTSWQSISYAFRFSSDGNSWLRVGPRTIVHDDPH